MINRKRPKTIQQALPRLRRIMRRFWPQIRKQKGLLLLAGLALVAKVLARLLAPWPLKLIFDFVLVPDAHSAELDWPLLRDLSPNLLLAVLAIAIIATAALRAMSAYASLVGLSLAASRIIAEVRADLYAHIQRLSLSFHYRSKSGDLITRLTSDVDTLRGATVNATLPLAVDTLTLISMVCVMFWIDWELALIGTMVFPLFVISSLRMTKRIKTVSRQQRRRESAMAATVAESIGAIKVVQALSLEKRLEKIFASDNRQSLEDTARTQQLSSGLQRTAEILVAIATALVLWRGAILVQQGTATPGDLLVFITYLKTAFKPTRDLAKEAAKISKATASGERIIDLFEMIPDIRNQPGAIAAPPFHGDIAFRNVYFAYEANRMVLENVSFEAKAGQRIALVGPSGSGKSTLVSLLLRLYDPLLGQVTIDGRDIREYELDSLRQQISIVLQDSILFGTTVRENIAYGIDYGVGYGSGGVSDAEIEKAAKLANAHDFILRLPDGYDTLMSERGSTLSGGQRQRIAIARAAVRQARIVILDEPTVGLDNKSEKAVNEALTRLTTSATTFLITHDLRVSKEFDQILYVENGQILERGTHSALMHQGGHYAALYQIQTAIPPEKALQTNPKVL
ncbi:ABC transporter, ATP-binding protein [Synechococcus sp. PCC 7335]|uniref:ABC transporter ATP-binding protein n=1 Tax=Synechococcus sp. (strain ATCC 29403 / PCC 7335) TaxID=91464 RepID=UPI00017EDFCA|nr:ABC transporter ATP-binding protein [Synechococcus sp. PCC 7335]EDX85282.1 ABC transporter, ATP-binding protein [Synechococcus sp. PCC 7335]